MTLNEAAAEEGLCPKRGPVNDFRWNCRLRFIKKTPLAKHSGMTGNLSAAGVYIRADASLEMGSTVEFEITLPPEMTGAKEDVVIQCRGRVVRTDESSGDPTEARGVACVIDSYDFVRHS